MAKTNLRKITRSDTASTSGGGDGGSTVSSAKVEGRSRKGIGGRPRKYPREMAATAASTSSQSNSRAPSPFSPANVLQVMKRHTTRSSARLMKGADGGDDADGERRSARLARYFADHPNSRDEYRKLVAGRTRFPPSIRDNKSVWHDGVVFRVGDIVSVVDEQDGLTYFAQLRALLTDSFTRHFAALTWLAPRRSAPKAHTFNAAHFGHALVDRKNYPIEGIRWVCTRPSHPAYCEEVTPRTIADTRFLATLNATRDELLRAARFEMIRGKEIIKAGDVKRSHKEDGGTIIANVVAKAKERREEREKSEEERRQREEMEEEKDKEEEYEGMESDHKEEEMKEEEKTI